MRALGLAAAALASAIGCADLRTRPSQIDQVENFFRLRTRPRHFERVVNYFRPPIQSFTLANGLTVYWLHSERAPLAAVEVCSLAGEMADPPGKHGVAQIAWRSVLGGAGGLDDVALYGAFARLGASPQWRVYLSGAVLGTEVLPENMGPAVDLLASMILRPTLDETAVARARKQADDGLAGAESSPALLGQRALSGLLYGDSFLGAQPFEARRAAVRAVTRDDVHAFRDRWVAPNTTALVLAGSLTEAEARAHAARAFGSWQGQAPMPPLTPAPLERTPGAPTLVSKDGLNQTLVLFGRSAAAAGDRDEAPLRVATVALLSKLNADMREQLRLTYGARVGAWSRAAGGSIEGAAWVRADGADAAVQAVLADLRKTREIYRSNTQRREYVHSELKALLLRETFERFDGVTGSAGAAVSLFLQRLPQNWYDTSIAQIQGVTADQVEAAMERYFDPQSMHVVLVGDPKKLGATLGLKQ
jgi:zinc protease